MAKIYKANTLSINIYDYVLKTSFYFCMQIVLHFY